MNNPFCLIFGKEPYQVISRILPFNEVLTSFTDEHPSQQIYMITGVRGSGKTVFLTMLTKEFNEDEDWIVIELNSSGEMLKEFAQKLYSIRGMSKVFDESGINLSFLGVNIALKKHENTAGSLENGIERMLEKLAKKKKRILISVDEVTNSKEMQYFAGAFQMFIRHELPVFLLMTGLYENINSLQNEKNLTFLYRAPKIFLKPLNIFSMAAVYEKTLNLSKDNALMLAKETKGYSFAFQVIGYFCFIHKGEFEKAKDEIKQYLDDYVYEKVWMELPPKERKVVTDIAVSGSNEVSEIKEHLGLKQNEFGVYRDRLIKKGILESKGRGIVEIALPYFDEYIREHDY
ncbi:MAG: ATP-binding protein [Lachnospiraceae bacterium]|nr:ATP-binding protein [Lachnospiraceae bacterium]